jgi:hypothetical protein
VAATVGARAAFALAGAGVLGVAAAIAWLASREGRRRARDPVDDGDEGVLELRAR